MNYNKAILFILSFTIALLFFSCEKTTEPEKIELSRRDYTWTVDTVKAFNTYLMKMWGSSPTDVWAVGNGGSLDDDIWHYDGVNWSTDGISRLINPWCIYGFSEKDIWVGGSEGSIWHYGGGSWYESFTYKNSDYSSIFFVDIWGETPDDVYAVGFADSNEVRFGLMMHYNGTEWSRVNIKFTEGILNGIKKGNNANNKYYIWNHIQNRQQDSAKYFEFDNEKLEEIYFDKDHWHDLTIFDDEVIFTIDNGIYTYNNDSFNLITENPYPNNYQSVYGRNKKDIIWAMADGLTHFNGTDFEYILEFDDLNLLDGVVFDDTVFFVSYGERDNYIFKGILK